MNFFTSPMNNMSPIKKLKRSLILTNNISFLPNIKTYNDTFFEENHIMIRLWMLILMGGLFYAPSLFAMSAEDSELEAELRRYGLQKGASSQIPTPVKSLDSHPVLSSFDTFVRIKNTKLKSFIISFTRSMKEEAIIKLMRTKLMSLIGTEDFDLVQGYCSKQARLASDDDIKKLFREAQHTFGKQESVILGELPALLTKLIPHLEEKEDSL